MVPKSSVLTIRGLGGHFYTVLTSFNRRALYKNVEKYLDLKDKTYNV